MIQGHKINRQLVLAERLKGEPTKDTLKLVAVDIPAAGANQMLLRTQYLSLDPFMPGWMKGSSTLASTTKRWMISISKTRA